MIPNNFLQHQLLFPRVEQASYQHNKHLLHLFQANQLNFPPQQLYIRIFKQDEILEIWATDTNQFQFIKSYRFTKNSGNPGPKCRQGDLQIPEGFYQIEKFNPLSMFHLSIQLNYPNFADSLRNKNEADPGNDIYIHGGNSSRGCIAIGDVDISELYWLCINVYAINPLIPVHIFPCKMEEKNLTNLYEDYPNYNQYWNSIKPMYHHFQSHKMLTQLNGCDAEGCYHLENP